MLATDSIFSDNLANDIATFVKKVEVYASTPQLGCPVYARPTLIGSDPENMDARTALIIMNQATSWQEFQGTSLAQEDMKWKYLKTRLVQIKEIIKFKHGSKPPVEVLDQKHLLELLAVQAECTVMLMEVEFKRLQKVRDQGSRTLTKFTKMV